MKNIKINILDYRMNNHWHYEILIDDKQIALGWYQYDIPYKFWSGNNHMAQYICYSKHEIESLKNKYAFIALLTDCYVACFSQDVIDLVIQKIYELYYNSLKIYK